MTLLTSPFDSLHENDILLLQSKAIIFINFDTTFRVLDFNFRILFSPMYYIFHSGYYKTSSFKSQNNYSIRKDRKI